MKEKPRVRPSQEFVNYHKLMQRRISRILLVCSAYDAYSLEEDGRIEHQIKEEYGGLNLTRPPEFIRASTAQKGLELLDTEQGVDMVISMYNVGEMDVFTLARKVKQKHDMPFVLLTQFSRDIVARIEDEDTSGIDHVFYWQGNSDLILAIIKTIEDSMNAENDILEVGVQSILLVEDSIRFYSSYLPALYRIVMQQSNDMVKESVNEQQQVLRRRSRPKILLATNYQDAVELYQKYRNNMLGVISDVGFVVHKGDKADTEKLDAGLDLCRLIRKDNPRMPFLLQSSQGSIKEEADKLGVGFVRKYSKNLLGELAEYIRSELSFGDLVLKDPQTGEVVGRASDLWGLQHLMRTIPGDVLEALSSDDMISRWLYARGLFSLGKAFKEVSPGDYPDIERMRAFLIEKIRDYRMALAQGVVAKFTEQSYGENIWMAKIGDGSLGGKGRGLAFVSTILEQYNFYDKYPGVRVLLPRTVTITTDYFDRFIVENELQSVIASDASDEEILAEFVASRLPEELVLMLRTMLKYVSSPLAVRSSSKLEDSHYQPFAGIYSTYMIPLADPARTLRSLCQAVKCVYASIYFASARQYITSSGNMLSEEKMAVVIQEVVGTEDSGYYFPTISGVARSLNYYPLGNEKPEDGVAEIAVGLGKMVVEGGQVLRFSPRHPKHILQLSAVDLALRETQRQMYALDVRPSEFKAVVDEGSNLRKLDINAVRELRNLKHVASTWDMQNQSISDSSFDEGRKIITFAHVLKYDTFPLAEILVDLLKVGQQKMNSPVEIEFAVNLDVPPGAKQLFYFLQIRPIVETFGRSSLDWDNVDMKDALITSTSAVGMGQIKGVRDLVYVVPEKFDNARTADIAAEVDKANSYIQKHAPGKGYVLVGPGRWGSSDPWLGVPVKWAEISEAKVIIECGLENFRVEPSQGTHFFQNLISLGVGYLTINPYAGDGDFRVEQVRDAETIWEGEFIRHVRFPEPLYIFVDGRHNKAVIKQGE